LHLAREGADIVVCGIERQFEYVQYPLFSPGDLDETVRLVEREDRRAVKVVVDVADYAGMQEVVETAVAEFGRVDIMVANAGFGIFCPIQDTTPEAWRGSIDTNLNGMFNALHTVAPYFIEQRSGRFIATASTASKMGIPNMASYCAAKWGVVGLIKAAALDLGKYNITCNAVVPGATNTLAATNDQVPKIFFPDNPDATMDDVMQVIRSMWYALPIDMIQPEDISKAVVFLASDDARYISGTTIDITAGQSAQYSA